MTTVYTARWILSISTAPIPEGAIAIDGAEIVAVGRRSELLGAFAEATLHNFGDAVILPGLVNAHSHLELTAMRGFLDDQESDFPAWLRKLTTARLEKMTLEDLSVSAAWGACEAARAGVTSLGDASDAASQIMKALADVGLRATVYQESFGPDPRLARENFDKLRSQVSRLKEIETNLVRAGVSPHAPYTVCAPQLEMIADLAITEKLPLMMHAAESLSEDLLMREGRGPFAESLASRGIDWQAPRTSTVQYLVDHGVLGTSPLLAHCINVDTADLESIRQHGASVAHCPKPNAKLGHGRAPFAKFLECGVALGFGSDSVASNNTCDILEEARFATLLARAGKSGLPRSSAAAQNDIDAKGRIPDADDALRTATLGGARALGLAGQVGELKVGFQADFIAVTLNHVQQVPAYDAASALVFASSGRDVVLTVVAGREIYRDGQLLTVDEERLRARMNEVAQKIRS
jgi:5-methylthioadenosine/S-adenosylhomocysteine deaminase